ncbi:unnamed protein product, partial [Aphanomyces euteiches]
QIALYIPVAKDFLSFLASFPDVTSLGDLQYFLELSYDLRPIDLWPKLQLDELTASLVPSVRRITRFFTTIYVLEMFDLKLLQQCLHPHNVVELLKCPTWIMNGLEEWLTTPISILPVQHMTIYTPRDFERHRPLTHDNSTLTRFSLSSLYTSDDDEIDVGVWTIGSPCVRFRQRHLESLAAWLRHCPATSISLSHWFVEDTPSAVELLQTIFASSTLESVSLDTENVDWDIQAAMFPARLCMQSLEWSYCSLNLTTMAALATALRHSNMTSLTLDTTNIDVATLPTLLDALLETNLRRLKLSKASLEDDACVLIAAALPSLTIVELNLSYNKLTDHSAKVLAEVVGRATSLTSLVLYDNAIGLQGATTLVKALSGRPQVTTWLDLGWNLFNHDEADWLNDMVEKTPQILKACFDQCRG